MFLLNLNELRGVLSMHNLLVGFVRFIKDERGVTSIEYALIASLVALVIVVGLSLLGGNVGDLYNNVSEKISACLSAPADCK